MKKNNSYWAYAIIVIAFTSGLFIHQLKKPTVTNIVKDSLKESVVTAKETAIIQKDATQKAIDEAVNKALLGESIGDSTIGSQIEENALIEDDSIKILEVISSNKVKLTYKGETKTARLIGVAPNGKKEHLQSLIDNTVNELTIERDTKKKDGEHMLIYLWDGEPGEVENMINIQMIKNEYANCTYNAGSIIIEQPNIKYFGDFIDATK